MARPTSGDKPKDIKDATIAEVAAVGSTAVSVNKIAARAMLSVGTLYRFHRTKNDLLFAVFLEIKHDIHAAMMTAATQHTDAKQRLRAMWFALVEYGFRVPQEFQFAEMISSEGRHTFKNNAVLEKLHAEILAEIQAGIDQGVLAKAPVHAIEIVLASPAMTLTRRAALSGARPSDEEISEIFRLIWRGIAA